jgi:hypothetical protein
MLATPKQTVNADEFPAICAHPYRMVDIALLQFHPGLQQI